jgi:hypothetical protein
MTMQRLWPHFDQFSGGGFALLPDYDPVWLRCLDEVLARLKGLAGEGRLPGIAAASIVAAEQCQLDPFFAPVDKGGQGLAYPGILVWLPQQESYTPSAGPNDRDEIVYPVAISFVDKGSGVTGTDAMIASRPARRRHMLWRERVSRRFRFASWPDITEIRESNVRYLAYAVPEVYRNNDLFHGAIVIDFVSWETRDSSDDGT